MDCQLELDSGRRLWIVYKSMNKRGSLGWDWPALVVLYAIVLLGMLGLLELVDPFGIRR